MTEVTKKIRYQIINGIRIPHMFHQQHIKEALEYKPRSDDNFIVTYPKCGTTWMQHIVVFIFRKGQPLEDYGDISVLSPFIDSQGLEAVNKMSRPGAIKTHLPYNLMPYSPDAKYIFVARNPRDTCVSLFYHTYKKPTLQAVANFDDFFESFLLGEVEYSDYFDHLLSWYPHRDDKNVWYTTYEQMKVDPKGTIYNVAKFLGKEHLEAIEKDNTVMNNIVEFTSFEYMKNMHTDDSKNTKSPDHSPADAHASHDGKQHRRRKHSKQHFRKGIVGDWKNHFSQEQLDRLDKKFEEKAKGTDLSTWWSY